MATQRSVRTRLTLDVNDYVQGTSRAEGATKRFGTSATTVLKGVATGYAAIKVGGLVAESVKLEAAYSKTMAQVAVATNAPKAQLKELDDLAMKLGADTVFSAQDSGQAMLELAKGGLSVAQIKAGALADTLTLASAGQLELGDSSKAVVNAMGAFQLKATQTDEAVAALAGSANASSADVSDMTQALAQAGTSANSAGLSIQETTAYLAMFANQGFKGSDAGTSLRTMLSRLVPQTKEADAAMKALGLTYLDSNGNLVDATEIAKRTQDAFKGKSDAERIAAVNTIFGADAQRAINAITAEGEEGLKKYLVATNDLTQAQKLADAANSGTAGSLEQLDGAIETAKIQIGKGLAPLIEDLAEKGSELAENGDFERWAAEAAEGTADLIDQFTPLAKSAVELGREALPTVAVAGQAVVDVLTLAADIITPLVDGFNKLPDSAQQALILAAGAQMLSKRLGPIPGLSDTAGAAVFGFGSQAEKGGSKAGKGSKGFGTLLGSLKNFGLTAVAMFGIPKVIGGFSEALDDIGNKAPDVKTLTGTFDEFGKVTDQTMGLIGRSVSGNDIGRYAAKYGIDLDKLTQSMVEAGSEGEYFRDSIDGLMQQMKDSGKIDGNLLDLAGDLEQLGEAYDKASEKAREQALAVDENRNAFDLIVNGLGQYSEELKGIPSKAVTEILTPGAVKSKKDVLDLAREYELTPSQVKTIFKALGIDATKKDIKSVVDQLDKMPRSKTVTLTTIQKTIKKTYTEDQGPNSPEVNLFKDRPYTGMQLPMGYAGGGVVPGTPPVDPTRDNVLALGANTGRPLMVRSGEWIINEKQSKKNDRWLALINAGLNIEDMLPGYAGGGPHGLRAPSTAAKVPNKSGDRWVSAIDANTAAIAASTKATDRAAAAQARFDKYQDLRGDRASRLDLVQQRQQIRDLGRDLNEKHTKGKRKGQYVLTGLDREAAKLELAAAKAELAAMKETNAELKKYGTLKAEKLRLAKAEQAVARAEAAAERAQNIADASSSFVSGDALGGYGSAASFERGLTTLVADSAAFTQILADLQAKGASAWLIEQLRREGPTKAAIRIGRQLLTDSARLTRINQLSGQYTRVGDVYGNLTAGNGTLTGGQRSLLVQVSAMDTSAMVREVVRQVTFQVGAIAAGGGI